jgi:hypothetical protein
MYKVAKADNHVSLEQQVCDLISKGYTPIGGIGIELVHIEGGGVHTSDGKPVEGESSNYATSCFYQAMLRK